MNFGTMPPLIESQKDVVYVDGIYLGRKACVLICYDEKHSLGWYLCRYENSRAWMALMSRIAETRMVVSNGGKGFSKSLKVMHTDQSIAKIYQEMNEREKLENSINMWGDAVVWG